MKINNKSRYSLISRMLASGAGGVGASPTVSILKSTETSQVQSLD